MLPSYFGYIFMHLRRKVPLRPELRPKRLSTLGPNQTRKARPDLQLCSSAVEVKVVTSSGAIQKLSENGSVSASLNLVTDSLHRQK